MNAPATATATQHGVRYSWPGDDRPRYYNAASPEHAAALMDSLAAEGITRMEPVRRTVSAWEIDPAGLPAALRHLAGAHVDGQVDDGDVRAQLAMWLAVYDIETHTVIAAWGRLCTAVRDHLRADDDGRTADVTEAEKRIDAAIAEICGGEL